ncbi:MAG TPA: GDP-mannose 4,6-dehydratase, partial [Chloroflexota bacterium]|nr:GDP-mannose 4,6-dehydratase [Chloroflexota bacterium]
LGLQDSITLGNLDSARDWGFAGDYVEAMWLMVQQDEPDDYVIATGETHSIQELCEAAFERAGLDWHDHVVVDQEFVRPLETGPLCGNPAKAQRTFGWRTQVRFKELIGIMVDADLQKFR